MSGLLGSMFTGNSGLQAASKGVSVVGDNIANVNTTGFKSSRVHFQEMLQEYVIGANGVNQIGRGVMMQRIEKLFTQGALQFTGVPTDLAVDGEGFFVVKGSEGGLAQNFYTRAGQFRFDKDGFLVSPNNQRVQGYSVNNGNLSGVLDDLQVSNSNLAPKASSEVNLNINLNPAAPVFSQNQLDAAGNPVLDGAGNPIPVSFQDALNAAVDKSAFLEENNSFRTTVVVYDSLGNAHSVEVFGTRTQALDPASLNNNAPQLDQWSFTAKVDSSEVNGDTTVNLGTLTFNQDGTLREDSITDAVSFAWKEAPTSSVSFGFGDATGADSANPTGTGRKGTTLWGEVKDSSLNSITQDGYGTGILQSVTVDGNGFITGAYTNGQSQILGQVAIARFNDPTGLLSTGANNFVETNDSGPPAIGAARTGSRGGIVSGSLEASNVELSEEFIDLIAYQRAFQANSKTIQTADGLMQEVIQILR